MKLMSVTNIWDQGAHNAFTDLVSFKQALFCVFREASAHVSPDGALRILCSKDDGVSWHSVALIAAETADLRDGKLVVYDSRLYLFSGGALHGKQVKRMQSYYWTSDDGVHWSDATAIAASGEWLWRITVHKDKLYGVAYVAGEHDGYAALYHSEDGIEFSPLVPRLNQSGYVNESGLVFDEHDTAYCLLRRDPLWGTDERALFGTAKPPYLDWCWQRLNCRIGGPVSFIHQGQHYAIVRLYDDRVRTALVKLDPAVGHMAEILSFPSGGDTSYAGIVLEDNRLLVSYYSSHEGHTAIYFAQIAL